MLILFNRVVQRFSGERGAMLYLSQPLQGIQRPVDRRQPDLLLYPHLRIERLGRNRLTLLTQGIQHGCLSWGAVGHSW